MKKYYICQMNISHIIAPIVIVALIGMIFDQSNVSYEQGRIQENKRLLACYKEPNFSGIAWVSGNDLFVCSSDLDKQEVRYIKP